MNPPIKNLIGGVKDLHTREYFLKISARMVGYRERSKIASRNSKNARTGEELVFLEREEGGGRRHTWKWGLWAPGALWARPGGRPPGPLVPPLVSPRCLWVTPGMEIFIFIFLEFF